MGSANVDVKRTSFINSKEGWVALLLGGLIRDWLWYAPYGIHPETRDQAEELARHFEEDFEPCPDPAHNSTPTSPTPPESRR